MTMVSSAQKKIKSPSATKIVIPGFSGASIGSRGVANGIDTPLEFLMRFFFDFITIIAYVATVLRHAMAGRLSPEGAAGLLMLLVVLLAIGHAMGTGLLGLVARIGLPLASATGLILHYSGNDPEEIRRSAGCFLALAIAMLGLYIMVRGVLPRRDRSAQRRRVSQGFEVRYRRQWW